MSWFAQADFWSRFYDWMFPERSFVLASEQVEDIIQISGITQGAILDLCCGPGRHAIPLSKRSFDVTGVDLQPLLLAKARDYASAEKLSIEFIEEDMLTFRRAEYFDLVISIFSSFGYFSNPDDDYRVLENAYCSLKRGGRILIELRGKEIHAMGYSETQSYEMPNGDLIFQRNRTNADWTSSTSSWVYVQGDRAYTYQMIYNLYSGAELRKLLQRAGFKNVRIYGSLKGIPYDQNAKRLVVLAEKQ